MNDPYRALLLTLLPLVGCTAGEDDSGDTDDTATPVSELGCYALPVDATVCPDPADVPLAEVTPQTCGATVVSVDGAATLDDCGWLGGIAPTEWCIYPITVIPPENECVYGRPLVLGGAPRLAPLARGEGWSTVARGPAAPERAAAWAQVGLAEHASVASFARFALELMALGAPAELVGDAHAAALDEVRHARLAFGLAARHAGVPVGPGPLPLADLTVQADLVALAVATVREGCVAETLSALQMAEARDRAEDEGERAVLAGIARDEARHAALAWRTVAWAVRVGGTPVREAVAAALAEAPTLPVAASGLLPLAVAREAVARGWREVVRPAADGLLEAAAAAS